MTLPTIDPSLFKIQPDGWVEITFQTFQSKVELVQLREILKMLNSGKNKKVRIKMMHIETLATGFFGLLCDWAEKELTIVLANPGPSVVGMQWFKQCFKADGPLEFRLCLKGVKAAQSPIAWS